MSIVQITDHAERSEDKLIEKLKKPKIKAALRAYVSEFQDLENVMFQLLELRGITTAVGVQLDGLGSIVGEDRQDRTDADYRTAISTRIWLNISQGTIEDVIRVVKGVIGGGAVAYREVPPAGFYLEIGLTSFTTDELTRLGSFLRQARGAGIGGFAVYWLTDPPFQYDTGSGYDQGHYAGVVF